MNIKQELIDEIFEMEKKWMELGLNFSPMPLISSRLNSQFSIENESEDNKVQYLDLQKEE